jgi:hypothetical protein
MLMTRALLEDVRRVGGVCIMNLSDAGRIESRCSPGTRRPRSRLLVRLALAKEVGRDGITLNSDSPGTTKTRGRVKLIEDWGGEKGIRAYLWAAWRADRPRRTPSCSRLFLLGPDHMDHGLGHVRQRRLRHGGLTRAGVRAVRDLRSSIRCGIRNGMRTPR